MNYQVEKLKGQVKINFSVSVGEWESEVENAYKKNKHKYSVPGFRKGKLPRKVIENNYGANVFFDEAFNTCASNAYSEALKNNEDIQPVDSPKVDIETLAGEKEDDKDLKFSITVTTRPEVTLGEYKNLVVKKAEYPVTAKDVDAEIEKEREKRFKMEKVERAIKDGDTVNLNYSGSVDGVKFDGGTAENQTLVIGSNSFIPGFEAQMIGMKTGEEKDLKVKFPDDYQAENLKGKDAVFAVKVNEITEKILPELNDEFIKDISEFNTVAQYKESIDKKLKQAAKEREENENKNSVVEAVVANAKAEIPACMINDETDYMLKDFEYRLMYMYQGMKIDDYFKYTNSSKEDFKEQRKDEAEKAVKTRLVLQELIKTEKIEVTDSDLDSKIEEVSKNANKEKDEYKKTLDDNRIDRMRNDILIQKTLDSLVSWNKFEKIAAKAKKDEAKKPSGEKTKKPTTK